MQAIEKDLESRKSEIQKELELLFKANITITDWDVPEADDQKVAEILLGVLQEKLDAIATDVADGKYTNY
ncbi:MAG TPA: hypothetical protein EYG70_00520 [Sulfurimonas sp.]|nr:hypothetical protein [Sulfurimonas sp.]